MTDIPEDVMKAARSAATTRLFSDRADKQADELTRHISRAIMAERERCAKVAETKIFLPRTVGLTDMWLDGPEIAAAIRNGAKP